MSYRHEDLLIFIGPCITVIVEQKKTYWMSLAILFHFLCAQRVSDINISIIRSLRLCCCWITTSVVLFSGRCVLEIWCNTDTTQTQPHQISNTHRTENKTTDVVIQQHSRKLRMMDILMSETCWTHKKWNKIASDIKLVSYPSTNNYVRLYSCVAKVTLWFGMGDYGYRCGVGFFSFFFNHYVCIRSNVLPIRNLTVSQSSPPFPPAGVLSVLGRNLTAPQTKKTHRY